MQWIYIHIFHLIFQSFIRSGALQKACSYFWICMYFAYFLEIQLKFAFNLNGNLNCHHGTKLNVISDTWAYDKSNWLLWKRSSLFFAWLPKRLWTAKHLPGQSISWHDLPWKMPNISIKWQLGTWTALKTPNSELVCHKMIIISLKCVWVASSDKLHQQANCLNCPFNCSTGEPHCLRLEKKIHLFLLKFEAKDLIKTENLSIYLSTS